MNAEITKVKKERKLVLSLSWDEACHLHDIIDNLSTNDIKHILTEREGCDYADALPGFVEEREAVVDDMYKHIEIFMDAWQNADESW